MEQPDEFKELQTLLRLKKYELPPSGYEERFLKEFHRRQRWEDSRPRGLALLTEKFNDWMGTFTVPKYAYVGTFGLFLAIVAAVSGINGKPDGTAIGEPPEPPVEDPKASFVLNAPLDFSDFNAQTQLTASQNFSQGEAHPRYILDARPASYEAPFSF